MLRSTLQLGQGKPAALLYNVESLFPGPLQKLEAIDEYDVNFGSSPVSWSTHFWNRCCCGFDYKRSGLINGLRTATLRSPDMKKLIFFRKAFVAYLLAQAFWLVALSLFRPS